MLSTYIVRENGKTEAMQRIRCKDEQRELQDILEHNYDLLPGHQINPDNPSRWMLIKREMSVPDPSTGTNRWSIDFFFVDQTAMPTFVECKRFADTRSRREVVGQVLEYAANGHDFWSRDEIRNYAEASAKHVNLNFEEVWRALKPDDDLDSIDVFLDRVEENLKEGQIRIVFFLEEAPNELKSLVDFLNKQMERTEVLLVEARQFTGGGVRVVVPTLFGFTDQARSVKRDVRVLPREHRKWDWQSFREDAERRRLDRSALEAIQKLHDICESLSSDLEWGGGKLMGSFNAKWPSICPASVLSVFSNGSLIFNFGALNTSEAAESLRDKLKDVVVQKLGFDVPDDFKRRWPSYPVSAWAPKVDLLVDVLRNLLTFARGEEQ